MIRKVQLNEVALLIESVDHRDLPGILAYLRLITAEK